MGSAAVLAVACDVWFVSRLGPVLFLCVCSLLTWSFCTIFSTELWPFFFVFMKLFGELDVTIVMGLCWGESETRLITSTVSKLFHLSRSVLTIEECLRCRLLACSNFDWARASFWTLCQNVRKKLVRLVGCCGFLLGLPAFPFLCFGRCFDAAVSSWMSCLRLVDTVCLCPVGIHLAAFFLAPLSASLFVSFHLNRIFWFFLYFFYIHQQFCMRRIRLI